MAQVLPTLEPAPAGTLAAALAAVPDPRRPYGWRPLYPPVPLVALLQVAVAAMLCGARGVTAVAQWVRERTEEEPELLTALGLPSGRCPCVATFHRLFKALDVAAFEQAVGGWLTATGLAADEALAIDGKTLRGSGSEALPATHLVGVYAHHRQLILAQLRTAGKGHELAGATAVLHQVPIDGHVVTGDSLFTQRALCTQIVGAGGDYLFPVDENQPQLRADLVEVFSPLEPDRPGRVGSTAAAPVAGDRAAGARGAVERDHAAGPQGAPWTAGGADAVDARRPDLQ
jgi:hypothetical protein